MGYPKRLLGVLCAVLLTCMFAATSPLRGQEDTLAPGAIGTSGRPADLQSPGVERKKRVALIVGNSDYKSFPDLRNPANDARALGTVLKRLGFEIVIGLDLDAVAFRKTIQKFLDLVDQDTVALFFYAGHGLQVNGLNYMIPIDAQLASQNDLEFETIRFNLLLEPLESNSRIGIVFLDACRDNPLAKNLSGKAKNRSLGSSRGLAPVQTGDGLFIGYATQPDNVAVDGDGPNSPFTTALLHHLETPGFDIEMLMRKVRDDVIAATDHAQVPWSNSSLSSEGFAFKPTDVTGPPLAAIPSDPGIADKQLELELWRSIGESDDRSLLEGYLRRYPDGIFSDIVKSRLKLRDKKSKTTSVQPNDVVKSVQPTAPSKKKTVKPQTKTTPTVKRTATTQPSTQSSSRSSGRCRDGNVARCRMKCTRGEKGACDMLKKLTN